MVASNDETVLPGPRPTAATRGRSTALDLPGLLPFVLVAATWEFLLIRIVTLAASVGGETGLDAFLGMVRTGGVFAQNLTVLIGIVLLGEAMVALVRDSTFGPLVHRITVSGFAAVTIAACAVGAVIPLGPEPALTAHAAGVLLSFLLVLGLAWHRVRIPLIVGAALLLLPTLLRFYASCAISVPFLRTESSVPSYAYHAAEAVAVLVALASPLLFTTLRPRDGLTKSSVVAFGLASLPAVALAAAMVGSMEQVRGLCRAALGFEMTIPGAIVVYPVALFALLLTISALVVPGSTGARSHDEQRLGYGLALLFFAGLDGLEGTVLAVGAGTVDIPELMQYLLEGNWSHMTREQQSLIGPPLRDLYRVALLVLGYVLVARSIHGRAVAEAPPSSTEGEET